MEEVRSILRTRIRDRDTVFVFPSEVAAAFWRQEALRCTEARAVESSRFLSWDRFKEHSFFLTRKEKPVNSTLRLCFIHTILGEHAERGVPLHGIIPEGHRENAQAFVSHLERLIPSLGVFPSIREGLHMLDREEAETISFLYHEYSRFLGRYGLFEPAFEVPDLSTLDKQVTVFFPELIEDFTNFREVLTSHPSVQIVGISETKERGAHEFRYFKNSLHEIRQFLIRMIELLEGGVAPQQIAVTIADSSLIGHLRHQAFIYNVPLDFRMGDTISAFPGGRIFSRMAECLGSDFHMDDCKNLFFAGGIPWKQHELIEKLIETGIGTRAVVDSVKGEPGGKRWVKALTAAGESEAADLFAGIQAALRRIAGAETAEDLRQELLRFSSVYIDEKRWPEDEKKVFQYALDLLAGIDTALSGIPMPTPLTPFKLFLYQVDKTIYVPKTSHKGIPVYPYRVAAGTAPLYHFVLGISQEKCSVRVDPCRFLRKDEKKKLGIEENDMGSAFLEAYAVSGQRVFFSSGSETFGGKILVPEVFLEHFQGASSGEPETAPPGLFGSERALWYGKQEEEGTADAAAGDSVHLTRLFPIQKRGFLRAEHTCLTEKRVEAAGMPFSDSSLLESIRTRLEKAGTLGMSPTSLEEFSRCPFSFLFSRVLRIEEQEYNTRYTDPLFLGSFAHEVVKRVYRRISTADSAFNAQNIQTYMDFAEEVIHEVRVDMVKKGYVFIPPVWEDITRRTGKWIGGLFELEKREFNGLAVLETERRFEAEPEEGGFTLFGQIDRLSGTREEAVLIDYKKKSRVTKVDISGSETDPPVSFQIPIYIFLAEAEGYAVSRAGYISFEEGKYVPVLEPPEKGKGWFEREEIDTLLEAAVRRAGEAVEKIARGNFPAAGPGCDPCRFRGVCRVKYIAG